MEITTDVVPFFPLTHVLPRKTARSSPVTKQTVSFTKTKQFMLLSLIILRTKQHTKNALRLQNAEFLNVKTSR